MTKRGEKVPTTQIGLNIPTTLYNLLEERRGDVQRAVFIRKILERYLDSSEVIDNEVVITK